jgi:glycosyltransferase involved in cell wall biosynthesis
MVDSVTRSGNVVEADRLRIVFFSFEDVFEDFYPHYGVEQQAFATHWADTGNHAWVRMLQEKLGDVVWYEFSLDPRIRETVHQTVGCRVRFLRSSWIHRALWKLFYSCRFSWRFQKSARAFHVYGTLASYTALLTWPFAKVLRQERPDVFFVQEYSSGRFDVLVLIARMMRVPVIAYHAGSLPERYLGKFLRSWSIPAADKLIVSSRHEQQYLMSRWKVAEQQAPVILPPIDIRTFVPMDRTTACRKADLDPQRRYVLFFGRLDDHVKRISAIIKVFTLLKDRFEDVDLLIAGAGLDEQQLRGLAMKKAAGRIHFLGWISGRGKQASLYNCAECLLLPSRREGFPTVVAEAMACGTPVLASRVGGVTELVEDGRNGWLIEAGDDEALRHQLSAVLSHPNRSVIREAARESAVDKVAVESVARQVRAVFEDAGVRKKKCESVS